MQSSLYKPFPQHVAIIMDGNGRWATRRGLDRSLGHRAGAHSVRNVVEAAVERGISVLTLYAFSADNWRRPRREVAALMRLLERYLMTETANCIAYGVRVNVIGRRDRRYGRVIPPTPAPSSDAGVEQDMVAKYQGTVSDESSGGAGRAY